MPTHLTSQSLKPLLSAAAVDDARSFSFHEKDETYSLDTETHSQKSWLQPRIYLPVSITLGQSIILLGGWAFFLATRAKPTPLPVVLVMAVRDDPQAATFIITLVATLISITTAFFYSHAIRYTVAMSLSQPMSLFALASSMKIAGKRPVLNFRRWKWTIAAFICVVALSAQTAGWTTLLTPKPIQTTASLTAFGVDMGMEQFINKSREDFNDGKLQPYGIVNVHPALLVNSGVSAVSAMYGQTSSFLFNEMTYHGSTAGTLLLNMWELISVVGLTSYAQLPICANLTSPITTLPAFPANYTVEQQGLTAEVHCEHQELNATTVPSLEGPETTHYYENNSFVDTEVTITCRDGVKGISRHTIMTADPVYMVLCTLDHSNEIEFELILTQYRPWLPTTICTISPKLTLVEVYYSQGNLSVPDVFDDVHIDSQQNSTGVPGVGFVTASIMYNTLKDMQNPTRSPFSDALSTFYYAKVVNADNQEDEVNRILEKFLTGAFEFTATLIRASYTDNSYDFWEDPGAPIPEEFRYHMKGTFVQETIGWHQTMRSLPRALLAPTFVTALSIILVIMTCVRTARKTDADSQDYFDLNNFLHVIAAASAGDFDEPFPSAKADDDYRDRHSERVKVKLGYTKSGGFSLIQQSNV